MNEAILKKLLLTLNQQLPTERISLSNALKMERPKYRARDNKVYQISEKELIILSEHLPENRWPFLKIPIILRGDPTYENPGWIVTGADECQTLASIVRKPLPNGDDTIEMKFYMAHMLEIRKNLPTATVIMSLI